MLKSPDKKIKIRLLNGTLGHPAGTVLTAEARGITLAKADIFAAFYVFDADMDLHEIHESEIGKLFEIIDGRYIPDKDFCNVMRNNPKARMPEYEKYFR